MGSLTSRREWPPVNKGFQKMWEKRLVKTKSGKILPQIVRVNSCRDKGENKVKPPNLKPPKDPTRVMIPPSAAVNVSVEGNHVKVSEGADGENRTGQSGQTGQTNTKGG
jgi:hypothetical protein